MTEVGAVDLRRVGVMTMGGVTALLLFVAMLFVSPAGPYEPTRDSGVFLYAGRTILHGGLPYRDVWDHKPPAVFYVNALGLLLRSGSLWGVWIIEVLFAAAATAFAWATCRKFGATGSWSAALMAIAGLWFGIHRAANMTEEYAVALQLGSVALWGGRRLDEVSTARACAIGLAACAAFLLKPPLVATWLPLAVVACLKPVRHWARTVLAVALSSALPLLLIAALFWRAGALGDALDQIFGYSAAYVSTPLPHGLALSVGRIVAMFVSARLPLIALAYFVWRAFHGWDLAQSVDRLVLWAMLDLPLEVVLSLLPRRPYDHYFLATVPPLAVLSGAAIGSLWLGRSRMRPLAAAIPAVVLLSIFIPIAREFSAPGPRIGVLTRDHAVTFLRRATRREDPVVVWGAESAVLFLADRDSPSRYVYQYPLFTTNYHSAACVREFLWDLRARPPRIIIDTSATNPAIPPLDVFRQRTWKPVAVYQPPANLEDWLAFVRGNYVARYVIDPGRWIVYVRRGDNALER